jgi:hypothetical protein
MFLRWKARGLVGQIIRYEFRVLSLGRRADIMGILCAGKRGRMSNRMPRVTGFGMTCEETKEDNELLYLRNAYRFADHQGSG